MRKSYFPWLWPLTLFAVGCAAASIAVDRLATAQAALKDERFDALVERAVQRVAERINVYEYGLRGARGAVIAAGTEQITREGFRNYAMSRVPEREFPGARGFGFIRRVEPTHLDEFLEATRADEKPEFALRQLEPHDGDLLVIEYIEPAAGNLEAIGLDIASESNRRAAAQEALRSGNPTLSRPITLVQASGQPQQSFVFLIPVYRNGAPIATPEERWQAGVGLAYAPLVIDEVLASMDVRHDDVAFALFDADTPGVPQRFYTGPGSQAPAADGLMRRVPLPLYGRQWLAEFRATPGFVASLGLTSPGTALQAGVGASALLAVLLYFGLLSVQQRRQAALDNARMAAIAESVSDGIIGLDAQERVMSWNRAAEQIFGYPSAEAIGRMFRDFLPAGTDSEAGTPAVGPAQGTASRLRIVRRTDGAGIELDLTRAPVRARGAGVVGTAVTVRNVTAQRSADERFRLAVDAAPTAMLMVDSAQQVVLANRKAEELFGYREPELLGMPIDTLVPMRYRARHAQDFAQYMQTPRARAMGQGRALFALHRDGREIPVEIGLSPVHTQRGLTTLATVTDVSQRWALEMQLQATLERLQMAVGVAGLGVWVWRLADNQLIWDERMFSMYDASVAERDQGPDMALWRARVHPDDLPMVEDSLQRQLRDEATFDPVFRVVRDSGEVRYIQAAAIVERTADGKPVQIVGINRDITDQKTSEARILEMNTSLEEQVERRTQQLYLALETAETATRAKSEFLANMSHEIRSPMNAILGLCYLLEREDLPVASREMVLRIQGAGSTLLGIINDILDLSKIEAHRLEIERAPFSLSEVLDNLASIMASSLGNKPLELVVASVPDGAEHLIGDSLRLSQVLVNLASNAIKFTAQGEVVVCVERMDAGDAPDSVTLRFAVRDTGIGIAQDKQAQIFEAFNQADSSTTRRYGGTGLGLTISSRLVALMGGRLAVDSTAGRGSSFCFTLQFPIGRAASSTGRVLDHLRVLVADDNAMARAMLAEMVRGMGWRVDVVAGGEQAVQHVCGPQAPLYDIVLLDLHMPEVDGLQAAQRIRDGCTGAGPPLLVMATARDRDRLLEASTRGVVDHIVQKPVTSSALYNAVVEIKKERDELRFAPPPGTDIQRLRGLCVLIVDDSEINRDVAASILGREGVHTLLAENGAQALAILEQHGPTIDGVLMDIQMPGMDGYEATRRIRSTPALSRLPVVALSAGAFASQRAQALAAGVDAFVAKPFHVDTLVETLQRLCRPAGGHSLAAGLPAAPANIDLAWGMRVWGDPPAFARALGTFMERYGDAVTHISALPPEEATAFLHKLKGVAAQLGLGLVAARAQAVEHALHAHTDETLALDPLRLALESARAAIQDHVQATVGDGAVAAPSPPGPQADPTPATWAGLLEALLSDDPLRIESALTQAAPQLPGDLLGALRTAVAYYEFRAAEDLVRSAAATAIFRSEEC